MKAPVSLATRLSLLFAASAVSVLLVAGLLFERAANSRFLAHDQEELSGKIELIRKVLHKAKSLDSTETLPTLINRLRDTMVGHPGIAVTVSAGDGHVLYSQGGPNVIKHLLQGAEIGLPQPSIWTHDNKGYRILANRIPVGMQGDQLANVAIAFDISDDQAFLVEFRESLWFGMALAAIAMWWLAWMAVKQGLAPLVDVTDQMVSISADQLDRPIAVESVPRELKDLVLSFNTMLSRLHDSFERLSEFSSDIAHELRTPIQNLLVHTEVTLAGDYDLVEIRSTLQSNMEEFARLSRMISDMLFLAKADNSLLVLHQDLVDLGSEVAKLLEFYEVLASEKAVHLSVRGSATINADRLMIQRAISNLLSNALRYTPEGGSIEVILENETLNQVAIAVVNEGPPIAPEHLPRIFDRLYRADPSRKNAAEENAGLGLAITRSIVAAHRGTIKATSEDGYTTFTMVLPSA